ncbi:MULTISPECIES: hypothetical protein [unclassified Clostridium]|uniref:hypothetical protein n=1 Tax=unclassified Clostridium TaxID=2614128 RepID=UPI0002981D6F|nr:MULTISPECIES: hypothetical protein [unclassified Clostridium]EKQ50461.1 MAG: hypothetical protein A370_05607 [Clostridium sp. Maddingley MBC34-26]
MDNIIQGQYRRISLNPLENEEYELNNDNIGEIEILNFSRDISKNYKVTFEMSKEAMIGFGISAIRLDEGLPEGYDIRVEPLGSSCANQPMGFFLTPDSPELFFYGKEYGCLKDNLINIINNGGNDKKYISKRTVDFLVDLEWDNDYYEIYSIGFNNVARIRVFEDENEITSRCDIVFRLSKSAFLGFGTSLIRIAHKYKEGDYYLSSPVEQNHKLGFYLTNKSIELEIKCKNNNTAFYYDRNVI